MANLCCVVWRHPIVVAFLSNICDTRCRCKLQALFVVIFKHAKSLVIIKIFYYYRTHKISLSLLSYVSF